MASLILAVRFLTIVPVPGPETGGVDALGRAAWWFPVVGLALGAVLAGLDRLLALAFPPLLSAVLVVAAWKLLTGGIHLDGLADSLDALGGSDTERRLAILRDSRIGVFGASGLILTVLTGVVALAEIPRPGRTPILLLAPMIGRTAPLLCGAWIRAATPDRGVGASFLRTLPRLAGPAHFGAAVALALLWLGPIGVALPAGAVVVAYAWTALVSSRFGGLTGDGLGGAVEVSELTVVVAGAALAHRGWL
jgi:adenosylcobinamide-GDP ribazoletransferase